MADLLNISSLVGFRCPYFTRKCQIFCTNQKGWSHSDRWS